MLDKKTISWEEFWKSFKKNYISEHSYDDHAKELHELRLGHLAMGEFMANFIHLLRYFPYIKEEKAKV